MPIRLPDSSSSFTPSYSVTQDALSPPSLTRAVPLSVTTPMRLPDSASRAVVLGDPLRAQPALLDQGGAVAGEDADAVAGEHDLLHAVVLLDPLRAQAPLP